MKNKIHYISGDSIIFTHLNVYDNSKIDSEIINQFEVGDRVEIIVDVDLTLPTLYWKNKIVVIKNKEKRINRHGLLSYLYEIEDSNHECEFFWEYELSEILIIIY